MLCLYPTRTRLDLLQDVYDGHVILSSTGGEKRYSNSGTGPWVVTARIDEMIRAEWISQPVGALRPVLTDLGERIRTSPDPVAEAAR